ncbi:MAG: DUF4166 domain-containing protein [Pseudomonadota bacterium]
MKVLILGGYGTFGGRLAHLLSDLAEIEILIAGRSRAKAQAFCSRFAGAAKVTPLALDRADIASALVDHRPDLVVDASGPFQDYGNDRYQVIEACINAGVDYMDLADGADFVEGVEAYDQAARDKGIFVLSGVSSFPVLTAAVLADIATRMDIVDVEGGIAPSPYAGVGQNVLRAVLGYAGDNVRLTRNGRQSHARGLVENRRRTISVPGHLPLHNTRFSLVDVPDLRLIPAGHPSLRNIWMGAGPVPEILHRLLNALAWLRSWGLLPRLAPLAPICHVVLNALKAGEHRGGMYVAARDDTGAEEAWHLLAEGDDGPLIPSMAIEVLVRKLAAWQRPKAGARSGIGALRLADYRGAFERRQIKTGFRSGQKGALYENVLGSAFCDLPRPIQAFHAATGTWRGTADITGGQSRAARALARLLGFPRAGKGVPVSVTTTRLGTGERWQRDFGRHRMTTTQTPGVGRMEGLIVERFGAITVGLALVADQGRLYLIPRRWSFLGIPLPKRFLPSGETFETETASTFQFDVTVRVPVLGLIAAYRGTLMPA